MPSIAIVGASANREKFGNKAVRAFLQRGYTVFPVNPRESEIEGQPVFARLEDVPATLDEVSFYLPPALIPALLPAAKDKGARILWLNPGTESDEAITLGEKLGLDVRPACSIVALGLSPSQL
jgi:predicted CoA-binding protein